MGLSITVSGKKGNKRAMAFNNLKMEIVMLEIGVREIKMEMGTLPFLMEAITRDNFSIISFTEKASIIGLENATTRECMSIIRSVEKELWHGRMDKDTKANSSMIRCTVRVVFSIRRAIFLKENGRIIGEKD